MTKPDDTKFSVFKRALKQAELQLEVDEQLPWKDGYDPWAVYFWPERRIPLVEALNAEHLTYGNFCTIIEDGTAKIVPFEDATAFWRKWWRKAGLRPPKK